MKETHKKTKDNINSARMGVKEVRWLAKSHKLVRLFCHTLAKHGRIHPQIS